MPASATTEKSSPPRPSRLKTILVTCFACAAIFFLFKMMAPQTVGEQARRIFQKQLADHYQDWDIAVGRGVYHAGVGLQFDDITLNPKQSAQLHRRSTVSTLSSWWSGKDAVAIDRIFVFADIHPSRLLEDRSPLDTSRISIEGITARVELDESAQVSIAGLWPPPQFGPACPRMDIKRVELFVHPSAQRSSIQRSPSVPLSSGGPQSSNGSQSNQPLSLQLAQITVNNTCMAPRQTDGQPSNQSQASQYEPSQSSHWQSGDSPQPTATRQIQIVGNSDFADAFSVSIAQKLEGVQVQSSSVTAKFQRLRFDSDLLGRFRSLLPSRLIEHSTFAFDSDLQLRFEHMPGHVPHDYQAEWSIHNADVTDPRLPQPVKQLRGRVRVAPNQIVLFPTQAYLGDALCRVRGETRYELLRRNRAIGGTAPDSLQDFAINFGETRGHFSAESLKVDQRFASILPDKARGLYERWQPHGHLNVDLDLFNPNLINRKTWQVAGDVRCMGVDVRFDKFPYPVEQLVGPIKIAGGFATTQALSGTVGDTRVFCGFEIPIHLNPDLPKRLAKSVVLQTEGPIEIDDALLASLTPVETLQPIGSQADNTVRSNSKLERFVRSLRPRGSVELASASIVTNAGGQTTRQFDLRVTEGSLRYAKFPYPLYNVAGRIQIQDNLVRMIGFTANNAGAGKIACDGLYEMPLATSTIAPARLPPLLGQSPASYAAPVNQPFVHNQVQSTSELNLRFRVADLAMDQSLRSSIPESSRGIWDSLAPAGTLDRLDARIHQSGDHPIDLSLAATQLESSDVTPKSLNIRPTALPYRIDIVGGSVTYSDDQVEISDLRGRHDASELIADGGCTRHPSGRWMLSLDLHSGCRIIPDEELNAAMPEQMSQAMRALDLRGPVRVRGHSNVLLPDHETVAPIFDWDLALQLEGNRISDVGPVHSLRGEILVSGVKDSQSLRAGGTVAIDSLHAYGWQVTSLRGPFSIVDEELRLGTLANSTSADSLRPDGSRSTTSNRRIAGAEVPTNPGPVLGTLFDGDLTISGVVKLSTGDFDVGASVTNAQIGTALAEMGQTGTDMTGRLDFNSRLDGRFGDIDLLKGSGTGRLSGANLYQLPYLVQVLNLLRITPTEDVAFTDGETEFTIFGEDLNFNRLTLWGDLVALDGGGTLSRQEHLDMSFNTRVSPQNLFSKVISPLRDSSYTLWTIEVDGPLTAPTIQRRALGGVGQTLEDWFPGMVRSSTANTNAVNR